MEARDGDGLTAAQRAKVALFDRHVASEFRDRDAAAAMTTMTEAPHLDHVPVMTGGRNRDEIFDFYARQFIPGMPSDTEIEPISRTVDDARVVIEIIFKFAHAAAMPWMLPGIAPTGRRVAVPMVVIVHFKDGRIDSEHIYWDQASVLVQLDLLSPQGLRVAGIETARKLRDPSMPSNGLIERRA